MDITPPGKERERGLSIAIKNNVYNLLKAECLWCPQVPLVSSGVWDVCGIQRRLRCLPEYGVSPGAPKHFLVRYEIASCCMQINYV